MPHTVSARVRKWARELREPDKGELPNYVAIHAFIDYLSRSLYSQYVPTTGAEYPDFAARLRDWLDSASDEADQKVLLQTVPMIFFVGREEMESLYRSAYNASIARWLLKELQVPLHDRNAQAKIRTAARETFFWAITDSLDIGQFYRINHIRESVRPQLKAYLDIAGRNNWKQKGQEISDYMDHHSPSFKRLVLLEDFVGTGRQSSDYIEFAASLPSKCPVLFCSLMTCAHGANRAHALMARHHNLTCDAVLELPENVFLWRYARPDEHHLFVDLRDLVVKLHPLVEGSSPADLDGPFGFNVEGDERGALVVLYTNCPDNTLPIIHHDSDGPWHALFPRNPRL
jgi:hypothetical protein